MFSHIQIKSEKHFHSGKKKVKIKNGVQIFQLAKRYKLDKNNIEQVLKTLDLQVKILEEHKFGRIYTTSLDYMRNVFKCVCM